MLGSRALVMSPRPGRVTLDLDLPFSASGLSPAELRALAEAVAAAERLRAAIAGPEALVPVPLPDVAGPDGPDVPHVAAGRLDEVS